MLGTPLGYKFFDFVCLSIFRCSYTFMRFLNIITILEFVFSFNTQDLPKNYFGEWSLLSNTVIFMAILWLQYLRKVLLDSFHINGPLRISTGTEGILIERVS